MLRFLHNGIDIIEEELKKINEIIRKNKVK